MTELMTFDPLTDSARYAIYGMWAVFVVASLITLAIISTKRDKDHTEMKKKLRTWGIILGLVTVTLVTNKILCLVFWAFVSFLALKEYLSIIPTRHNDRLAIFWAFLMIPANYYLIYLEWYGFYIVFIPIYSFAILSLIMVRTGDTDGFIRSTGVLYWGIISTVFCISHFGYLYILGKEQNPNGGAAGLVLYLFALGQFNDVAQFTWGKSIGRIKVAPTVSPNKTVEGLLGGMVTTTVISVFVAPYLTPMSTWAAVGAGVLISFTGFLGDVTISAIKRDLGIKDSSQMLPGHGGILDRVDSLIFSVPLFFHYMNYLYFVWDYQK